MKLKHKIGLSIIRLVSPLFRVSSLTFFCGECSSPAILRSEKKANNGTYIRYRCEECNDTRYFKEIELKHEPKVRQ